MTKGVEAKLINLTTNRVSSLGKVIKFRFINLFSKNININNKLTADLFSIKSIFDVYIVYFSICTFLNKMSIYKEVIQPHLPVRLPCYDFTLITSPALGALFLVN